MDEHRYHICACGNRLGERLVGGLEAQRHKRRRTIGLVLTQCEECLRWNAPPEVVALLEQIVGPFALPEAA